MKDLSRRSVIATTMTICHMPAANAEKSASSAEHEVRRAIEAYASAWVSGDVAAILNCYHPEFTLNYFGRNALARRHVGKAAAIQALGEIRRRTGRKLLNIVAVLAGAERGGLIARETMTANGISTEVERVYIYAVRDGLLLECWVYDQDQRHMDDLIGQ